MISQAELDRALSRWKARKLGGPDAHTPVPQAVAPAVSGELDVEVSEPTQASMRAYRDLRTPEPGDEA
jgi:hypothetical protein